MLTDKDKKGLWLIGAVAAVFVALIGVKFSLDRTPKAGPDNCVGEPVANTVFLLDFSEQVPVQTHDEIVARAMAHVRDRVQVNERVSVFTITALSKKELTPVVALCRPAEGGNRAIEDVRAIRKRFQEKFERPLRATLATVPGDSDESPIAQALIDISLSQYLRGPSNSLLVFSDMLENTPQFTLYHCASPSTAVARFRESRRGALERPHFQNTSVVLNVVPRLNQSRDTLACRDALWAWFFGDNDGPNAKLSSDYLPGGAPMARSPVKATKP